MEKRFKNIVFALNKQAHKGGMWQFNFLPTIYVQKCAEFSKYKYSVQCCVFYWAFGFAILK